MQAKRKILAIFLTAVIAFTPFYPALAAQVLPEIQPLNKPFGGKIIKIQACISPKALLLTIGPPTNAKFLLTSSSTIHAYGNIMPGVWTLGLAEPNAVNCRGNPAGIGGFSVGGLVGNALSGGFEINPIEFVNIVGEGANITTTVIKGVEIIGPTGGFVVVGTLGEALAGLGEALGALPIGAIASLIQGNFLGGGLGIIGFFDPTGITQIISLVFTIMNFIFPKKPPSLGNGYPIIRIGTGLAPSSLPTPATAPAK